MNKKILIFWIAVILLLIFTLPACQNKGAENEPESATESATHPLIGKWFDERGRTWEFMDDQQVYYVNNEVAYFSTWEEVDSDTITIDTSRFPIRQGDADGILTLDFSIDGDDLTFDCVNCQPFTWTRSE